MLTQYVSRDDGGEKKMKDGTGSERHEKRGDQGAYRPRAPALEFEQVGLFAVGEGKCGSEVLCEVGDLGDLAYEGFIKLLVVTSTANLGLAGLLVLLAKEPTIARGAGALEVSIVELGVNLHQTPKSETAWIRTAIKGKTSIDTGDIDLGRRRDNVGLVDPSQRNTVDLGGAADEQETRGKLLQEHDPLPPELASEDDEDSAGGNARTQMGWSVCLSRSFLLLDVLSRVEPRRLVDGHEALLPVVGTFDRDLLGLVGRGGGSS
jgi:hypothetical protein